MEIFGALASLLVLAIIVEGITQVVKQIAPEKIGKVQVPLVLALLFGVAITWLTSFNMFEPLGLPVGDTGRGHDRARRGWREQVRARAAVSHNWLR